MMYNTAAVITVSDKGAQGARMDTSGPAVRAMLEEHGWNVVYTAVIPDEAAQISQTLIDCADQLHIHLVLTTGGTGFSPRDVTPEATLAVLERETRGIPEAMRAKSMQITPRGCLSRAVAGIRGDTLIVNLPGSEKAARENLEAVLAPISHGLAMLHSGGSADCAAAAPSRASSSPSMDKWMKEAKAHESASKIGMYLTHNGIVRQTAKAAVREGAENTAPVCGMFFSYDQEKLDAAISETYQMEGIYYIKVWLNEGELTVGDDIMFVLIGGDIRPHVIDALQTLVGKIKSECVIETEQYDMFT